MLSATFVGPDLDPNCLTVMAFVFVFFVCFFLVEELVLNKISKLQKSIENYTACK